MSGNVVKGIGYFVQGRKSAWLDGGNTTGNIDQRNIYMKPFKCCNLVKGIGYFVQGKKSAWLDGGNRTSNIDQRNI